MFNLKLDSSKNITVNYKNTKFNYSVNNTEPNPLEAFYASLNACAGVFAMKSCAALGLSPEGIEIHSKPVASPANPLMPTKFDTTVKFPTHFTQEEKDKILNSVEHCAVKEVIRNGADVEFCVSEI